MTIDEHGPLRLPPEREVTAAMRAEILAKAVDPETVVPSSRRRLVVPAVAGLAAAAVVLTVTMSIDRGDDADDRASSAGQQTTTAPMVPAHATKDVGAGFMNEDEIAAFRQSCRGADPDERSAYVLSARRMLSVEGEINALGYANREAGDQFFCTPFGIATASAADTQVTLSTPVVAIEGSRVERRFAVPGKPDDTTYLDGTWFALDQSVGSIEVRIVVDGVPGVWHSTPRYSSYAFAAAWRALTPAEAAGDVHVEYRAVSVDGQLFEVPGLTSLTADVAAAPLAEPS